MPTETFQGNLTGNAATVTTNANLTGDVTSVGNATTIKEAPAISAVTFNQGSEKITNGGFVSVTAPWAAIRATLASVAGGQVGNCLELTVVSGTTQLAYLDTPNGIATNSGKVYVVSLYIKSGTSGNEAFDAFAYSFGSAIIGSVSGVSSGSWVPYSFTFEAVAGATTGIYIRKDTATAGTMLFDSVSMKEVPAKINGDVYLTGNARVVIPTYANNAAAIAGGLVAGQLYRVNAATDPEPIYIVH